MNQADSTGMDKNTAALDAMLKEYESVRQESLDSINNRSQIVSLGLAALGLLVGGVLAANSSTTTDALVFLVFSLAIPLICIFVLYIWLGEVERMMRAGGYLRLLEARVNALIDTEQRALGWEEWLRTSSSQMRYPYVVVIALFLGAACGSPFLGLSISHWPGGTQVLACVLPGVMIVPAALHIRHRTRRMK